MTDYTLICDATGLVVNDVDGVLRSFSEFDIVARPIPNVWMIRSELGLGQLQTLILPKMYRGHWIFAQTGTMVLTTGQVDRA